MTDGSLDIGFNACQNEYHIRWWKDVTHRDVIEAAGGRDPHGVLNQWALGAAHHENRSTFGKHHIDRDWYIVRKQVLRGKMSFYCSRDKYLYADAVNHDFQGYENDGYIGYLSLRTRSEGCF